MLAADERGEHAADGPRNVWVAIALNLVIAGAGLFYLRKYMHGVAYLVFAGIFIAFAMVNVFPNAYFGLFIFSCIDSAMCAIKHNKAFETDNKRSCPHCAERIQAAAKVCKHCQREVPVLQAAA